MADLSSPVRHRLEILERTIYALQAQQRLLEYRVQVMEENQTLRQNVSLKPPQATAAGGAYALSQPYTQTLTPRVSKHRHNCVTHNLTIRRRPRVTNLTSLSFKPLPKRRIPGLGSTPER